MSQTTIGILHPGAMGVTVGASAATGGARALWSSEGRSTASVERATSAGLSDAGSLPALAEQSAIIVSVCPPHAAEDVAHQVAATGFAGIYVDGNAIAPQRARSIQERVEAAGARYVDGGIIGPPALKPGTTRLYLSGPAAAEVAACFDDGPLEAIPIADTSAATAGAASALKMAYAAYTKGTTVLLLAILGLARASGVEQALADEWQRSQPALASGAEGRIRASAAKAWRFSGEMEEIAATFAAAGLPDGFHLAAADLYARLERYRDADPPPSLDEMLASIAGPSGDR